MPKLVFLPELCTGCRACEMACSFVKEGVFSPRMSRIRVVSVDEEGLDIPIGCEQCDNAPCIMVCPVRAITWDAALGAAILDSDACIGCNQCLAVCPFGAIRYDRSRRLYYKCDYCLGDPECLKWCFTEALQYLSDVEEVNREKRRAAADRLVHSLVESKRHSVEGGS